MAILLKIHLSSKNPQWSCSWSCAFAISDGKTGNARARGNREFDNVYIEPRCWSELIESARERYNNRIKELDNKLKNSKWKSLDEFMLSYDARVNNV